MSDTVAIALITAGITGLVGLGGLAFNFWNAQGERRLRLDERNKDHREWYRRTLFEKRLQTAQDAYSWLMKVARGLNLAVPGELDSAESEELKRTCIEAREWYDKNSAFLYDSLPTSSNFVGILNAVAVYRSGRADGLRIWDKYHDAETEVRQRLTAIMNVQPEPGGRDD